MRVALPITPGVEEQLVRSDGWGEGQVEELRQMVASTLASAVLITTTLSRRSHLPLTTSCRCADANLTTPAAPEYENGLG